MNDAAILTGGDNPTGTITFTLTAPDGSTAATETVTVNGDNTYPTPTGVAATEVGTYYWVAAYSGDANNNPVTSGPTDEPVVIGECCPAITTCATPTCGIVGATTMNDAAILTGGDNPTGTITFTLTAPDGTTAATETVSVNGDGTYPTPTGVLATEVGTYYWVAAYSGDTNNIAVASGPTDEPVCIGANTPAITTSATPTSGTVGVTTMNDAAILTGGNNPTGTITFTLTAPDGTTAATETVSVNGDGTYPTPTGVLATEVGTYYWVAAYSGDTNNLGAISGPTDEPVCIGPTTPAITTCATPTCGIVGLTTMNDAAILTGGNNPTGTITFTLTAPDGTTAATETVNVNGDNTYPTPTGVLATEAGTYYWVAAYSGDTNNIAVTSGPTDEPVVIGPACPGISIVKLTNGINDPNPNGANVVQLAPGTPVTWTYLVTNTGNVPFAEASVVVTDNQPGVTPVPELNASGFIVGDTNDNDILDPGETWTYVATGTALNLACPPAGVTTVPIGTSSTCVSLGTAGNYAIVALNGFNINGPGTITGDVASGNNTVITHPAVINGTVYYSGSTPSGDGTVTGGEQCADLSQVFADAESAASAAAALPATQTFGTISNSTTIKGNGGINVVDLAGINLSNGALTLSGCASDVFILNVAGNITSSNSNITLSGGVTANHVLINVCGNVTITGGGPNNFYGTILDPNGQVTVHDKLLTGELIGCTITDTSGFSVCYQPFCPPTPPLAYENTGMVTICNTDLVATYVSNYRNSASSCGCLPQISVTKTADASTIMAGQTAGFTVTITNNGKMTDSGVTLSDPLPPGAGDDISWQIDTSGTGLGAGTNPKDFQITGAVGSQSLVLSSAFIRRWATT